MITDDESLESSSDDETYEIEDVAFIGRTFEEYVRMFDLDLHRLDGGRILDCPSGACAFVAEATQRGLSAVGADVMYRGDYGKLDTRGELDIEMALEGFDDAEELFEWDYYGDVDGLRDHWTEAYETFLKDYPAGLASGRYVPAKLPDLPFEDDAFTHTLSAHLLFLYADRLSHEFHVESLRELARVTADEVRVYPLADFEGTPYPRLDDLLDSLRSDGYGVEIRSVPFEFQRGATEILAIDCD
ncbi:hypothetical protein [Haladaptatus sp. T7]|uniref:hypothetical protein n=1 Tax=Haladaptatus sp. T7 TaxID=2029368 RepID=UPI0021A25472|nr:hypothetical protein [Haladaptatus sp. T7]GKZ12820.1 SAM-dependent methyltransferase [Haladaptatus sp. T7]